MHQGRHELYDVYQNVRNGRISCADAIHESKQLCNDTRLIAICPRPVWAKGVYFINEDNRCLELCRMVSCLEGASQPPLGFAQLRPDNVCRIDVKKFSTHFSYNSLQIAREIA